MEIKKIVKDKKAFLPLLLLADPCEDMIDRYLERGDMYVLYQEGQAVCEAVVLAEEDGVCELMNLATDEAHQGRGYASYLVNSLAERYAGDFGQMLVGTSETGVPFYEKLGFQFAFVRQAFFTKNYPDPIYEDGKQCIDMICLARALNPPIIPPLSACRG